MTHLAILTSAVARAMAPLSMVLALAACTVAPDPNAMGDMANVKSPGKCTPKDNKNCGCLGSAITGVKTCGSDGVWGTCEGCDTTGMDLSQGPSGCPGCTGCCNNGTCIQLTAESDTQCGNSGQDCAACSNGTCDKTSGTCTTTTTGSCASGCGGCCNASNACIATAQENWLNCGATGASCMKCPVDGGQCKSGACTNLIDPAQSYQIAFTLIDESDPAASGGLFTLSGEDNPDPFMRVTFTNSMGQVKTNVTDYCGSQKICTLTVAQGLIRQNQTDADEYSATNPALLIPGSVLIAGTLKLDAEDFDTASNDYIASGNLPALTQLQYGTVLMYGPYGAGHVKISYQLLPGDAPLP